MNRSSISSRFTPACLAAITLVLAACAHQSPKAEGGDAVAWNNATQMIVVTTADWNASNGTLRTYVKAQDGGWRADGDPVPVTIGRNGSAWGLGLHPQPTQADAPVKREGDGRAPAGVFAIGEAFGYGERAGTALPYAQMRDTNWCMDVPASPLYNRIVDAKQVGETAVQGSSEPMRLDLHNNGDQRYKNGFVIEHNREGRAGAGSCIFAHLWKAPGQTTAGCTAMAEPAMRRLYAWLRPEAHPVFVLLPQNEYDRLKTTWQLPAP